MSDEEGLSGEDDARLLARAAMGDGDSFERLALRDLEAIPGEECAEALGLTVPAMKSRLLHRARLSSRLAPVLGTGSGGRPSRQGR